VHRRVHDDKEWIMDFLTVDEYTKKGRGSKYWGNSGRWAYHNLVSEWAREASPSSVLELGCFGMQVCSGSDTMDLIGEPTISYDARKVPWPLEDKSYDIFIALQVWEHLDDAKAEAFREVMRISRRAILSFPYMWRNGNVYHKGITRKMIDAWTLDVRPERVEMVGSEYKRIVMMWDFDKEGTEC